MATARRFAFTERTKSGAERLMLANLDALHPFRQTTARTLVQMGIVPGQYPSDGSVPETYQDIAVSPDNAYVAVWSAQVGTDFVDFNIGIYDMETGALRVRFNEHSVAGVNRANCPCPLFDAFLASEAAFGVPQAGLDAYDYSVISEGTGIGEPTLTWSAAGTLIATYGFDVKLDGTSFVLGQGLFAFEVAVTAPPSGNVTILSRNAGIAPYSPMPSNPFTLRRVSGRALPVGPEVIHYRKQPVRFTTSVWKVLPPWLGWPVFGAGYRPAKRVQGFVG